jgi:hypothetical protein
LSDIDLGRVKALFEQLNDVVRGHPMDIGVAALQDLMAAAISWAAPTKAEALEIAASVIGDVMATIEKNYEFYHDPKNADAATRRRTH